jgi:hypothetical protein
MHIEAPAVIVGKPTLASTAAQDARDYKAEQTTEEQKSDFLQGIVDKASVAGGPSDRATALKNNISATLAEYKRRFNEAASPEQTAKITGALTEADAREQAEHFRQAYQYPLEDLQIALGATGLQREIYNKILEETARKGQPLSDIEKGMIENSVLQTDKLKREQQVLEDLARPLENYKQELAALNDLLAKGQINQSQFNDRVAELNAPLRQALQNAPPNFSQGGGFNSSDGLGGQRNYGDIGDFSKAQEENARYAQEQDFYQSNREQILQLGLNYDALEEAARQRHIDNLNAIDQARRDTQLGYAQTIADSVYSIASAAFGKQSAIARAAFAVEKGITIARASLALYANVAQAMKVGFPQNIPLIAAAFAQGAVIVGAIKGITAPQGGSGGYMSGGYTGDGGRSEVSGVVHGQEFVVNAEGTARATASLLEAINSGS